MKGKPRSAGRDCRFHRGTDRSKLAGESQREEMAMDAKTSGSPLSDPAKEPAALRSLLGRTNRDWWPNQFSLEILHKDGRPGNPRSEEHTSELQSLMRISYAVFC